MKCQVLLGRLPALSAPLFLTLTLSLSLVVVI